MHCTAVTTIITITIIMTTINIIITIITRCGRSLSSATASNFQADSVQLSKLVRPSSRRRLVSAGAKHCHGLDRHHHGHGQHDHHKQHFNPESTFEGHQQRDLAGVTSRGNPSATWKSLRAALILVNHQGDDQHLDDGSGDVDGGGTGGGDNTDVCNGNGDGDEKGNGAYNGNI